MNKVKVYKITIDYNQGIIEHYEKLFATHHLKAYLLSEVKIEGRLTINWRVTGNEKNHAEVKAFLFSDTSVFKIEI